MDLTSKLQLRPGQPVRAVNVPAGLPLDLEIADDTDATAGTALLVFVRSGAELASTRMSPSHPRERTASRGSPIRRRAGSARTSTATGLQPPSA